MPFNADGEQVLLLAPNLFQPGVSKSGTLALSLFITFFPPATGVPPPLSFPFHFSSTFPVVPQTVSLEADGKDGLCWDLPRRPYVVPCELYLIFFTDGIPDLRGGFSRSRYARLFCFFPPPFPDVPVINFAVVEGVGVVFYDALPWSLPFLESRGIPFALFF